MEMKHSLILPNWLKKINTTLVIIIRDPLGSLFFDINSNMKKFVLPLFVSLLFSMSTWAGLEDLYEDTSDDTAGFGSNSLIIQENYFRTLEQVRDATVLVSMERGFGSGIIITPEGLVLTNYHIIHGVDIEGVKVWFYAADELGYYTVDLVGIDPFADIALLQINNIPVENLPLMYLELENDKEDFKLAQEVWAVGHPLGMQWTVTKGILNFLERPSFVTAYVRLLQHTALIQKGNSGGPLVDDEGRVIGLNTYISRPDDALGFGYATRSDDVLYVIDQLIETGGVQRPAMGIQTANLNEFSVKAVRERYGEDAKIPSGIYGVVVYNLVDQETGEVKFEHAVEQGLKELDVLVAFDDIIINTNNDLHKAIRKHMPGDIVHLMLIRNGRFMYLEYELTSLDFDSYIEYYDKRSSDLEEKEGKEEKESSPEEEEKDEPVATPAPENDPVEDPEVIPPVEEEEVTVD